MGDYIEDYYRAYYGGYSEFRQKMAHMISRV